jgi:hypothetical protein
MTDIAMQLRSWTIDWNGAPMVDGEPPRDGFHCDLLRSAADEIDRLRATQRSCPCPQNTTPTAGECFETGYCSCGIGAALEQAAGEK